jgi:hypothetical protein
MNITQNNKLIEANKKLGLCDDLTKEKIGILFLFFVHPK